MCEDVKVEGLRCVRCEGGGIEVCEDVRVEGLRCVRM